MPTTMTTPDLEACRAALVSVGERRAAALDALDALDAELRREMARAREHRMTMDEIADAVGVSRKTLYRCIERG